MDLQKILEYRNSRNRFCQRLGIVLTELSPGYAKAVMPVTEEPKSAFIMGTRTLKKFLT